MDRALTAAIALSAAAVLAACSLAEVDGEGDAGAPCPVTRPQLVLNLINGIRVEHGLRALAPERRLAAAALDHTLDQASGGQQAVGHIGSNGSAPGDRVTAAGYEWTLVAENVASGLRSPTAVVDGWMNSPSHRGTILSPDAVHGGVGYAEGLEDVPVDYWTLVVAAPADPRGADSPACHP